MLSNETFYYHNVVILTERSDRRASRRDFTRDVAKFFTFVQNDRPRF